MTLAPGSPFGPYEVLAPLGSGGMGQVFRALDPRLGRQVAIKVLPPVVSSDADRLRRFEQEARATSALNHPSIVTIHEIARIDGTTCIVMELIEGRTLREVIRAGPVASRPLLDIAAQVADGLAKAHESGIVHRDLKPENVMVTEDGFAKILDFGLAKLTTATTDESDLATLTQAGTREGTILGTVGYMSPEQAAGSPVDARSDQFSLGAVLYELASGKRAFKKDTMVETLSAIIREAPEPLATAAPGCPAGFKSIVERCLEKDPRNRYASTRDLARDLKELRVSASGSYVEAAPTRRLGRWAALVSVGAILAAGGTFVALRPRRPAAPMRLAVLPFTNATGDAQLEYLSDGVTESVIGSLARLPRLSVIALSSVVRYKGRQVDPAAAARELGVSAAVVGRVVKRPEGLTISAELVDGRDDSRLWGAKYDTTMRDILVVQDEIATRISENLRLQLSAEDRTLLKKRYTENTEAYEAYLKGRYAWYKFTPEDYEKSLQSYGEAIGKDPAYALAWAGIGTVHLTMAWQGLAPPAEANRKAEVACAKALEIDPSLGRAHHCRAELFFERDWDFDAAEKEYARAIELDPREPIFHRFYGFFLRGMGRWGEAIAQMELGRQLDPLSTETNKALGVTFLWAGEYERAIAQMKKTLELDPTFSQAHEFMADAYARLGRSQEALAEQRQAFTLDANEDGVEALDRDGYAAGMRSLFRQELDATEQLAAQGYVSPIRFVILHAQLGEADQAFAWLERAYAERSPWLTLLRDPEFDGIRSDTRFSEMMRRVGLPPA